MPSLTPLQKAAFDAIDTLHVGQIILSFMYGEGKPIEWYRRILREINELLEKENLTRKHAEITKHYILATLEIHLCADNKHLLGITGDTKEINMEGDIYNIEVFEKIINFDRNFSLTTLSLIIRENGVDEKLVTQVVESLLNNENLALSTTPFFLKYELTERCFALEYPDAPLQFYHELIHNKIISCGKYSCKIDKHTKAPDAELSLIFIRAALLFEFKMMLRALNVMKSQDESRTIVLPKLTSSMPRTNRKIIADYHKRLVDVFLLEERADSFCIFRCKEHVLKADADRLFIKMSKFYFRQRMFGGTEGRWLGTLGAFEIEVSHWGYPELAIYYETDNSRTITEEVKAKLLYYGFNVSARNLYLRHKDLRKNTYPIILKYYNYLKEQGTRNNEI